VSDPKRWGGGVGELSREDKNGEKTKSEAIEYMSKHRLSADRSNQLKKPAKKVEKRMGDKLGPAENSLDRHSHLHLQTHAHKGGGAREREREREREKLFSIGDRVNHCRLVWFSVTSNVLPLAIPPP